MRDRDDLLNRIARVLHNNPPEDRPLTPDDCTVCDQALRQAAAVLAVLPPSDGPLRETLRQKVDFYRPPLVGGVVGYSPETITGISKDDAFEYALAFYDEIRALLDGAS